MCAKLLIALIKECSHSLDLKEIHLVNIDSESTNIILNEFLDEKSSANNQNQASTTSNAKKTLNRVHLNAPTCVNCDICYQRVREYYQVASCKHIYCVGCLIDLKSNKNECLIKSHEKNIEINNNSLENKEKKSENEGSSSCKII